MMTGTEIRQSFFDYFKGKAHAIVPSSPVVLPADPTLLFTNAGMNQFKEIFLGVRNPEEKRVANTQKCIRVSGKHNDLEEVGHDTYHHTFFEMLGNWSFGDYYKKEAISWAWELLTDVWKLPKDRLWATVYQDDDEAMEIWKEQTDIAPDHIVKFGKKDNFWEMGDTGPCGPCSEIHIDLSADGQSGSLVNAGSPEVIEIWNLVFIQFNRMADGSLEDLPCKHVDTGMGMERVTAVLQGKKSNYDTDLFQPIIKKIEEISGHRYEGDAAIAMRVIADHVRTLAFAIGDGVVPSNDGRGYVLRRLLRRAVRYGRKLDLKKPFMTDLLPVLEGMMKEIFPELETHREDIMRAIQAEENSFAVTLDRGMDLFDRVVAELKEEKKQTFPGSESFKLYDTFGFPYDLTELMVLEQGLSMDKETFDELMQQQRKRARSARKGDALNAEMDQISQLVKEGVSSLFTGYDCLESKAEVLAIYVDGETVDHAPEGAKAQLLLDKTPAYAESGGQIGDIGIITFDGGHFKLQDTTKPAAGLFLHSGHVKKGELRKGDQVTVFVDEKRRMQLQRHHTATHILNYALHKLVNEHIKQAGSYVAPDRLRFDFNHYEAISHDQLKQIEQLVNEVIMENVPVNTSEMALKEVYGSDIIAAFDEKYGDTVRVVDVVGFSKELCGGTHVKQTGQIGSFRIVNESSVAAGIRRIEAVCGWSSVDWTVREHEMVQQVSRQFSIPWEKIPERITGLMSQNKQLEKQIKEEASRNALSSVDTLIRQSVDVKGISLLAVDTGEMTMDNLRNVLDTLRQKQPEGIIVLGSANHGKACFCASVADNLVKQGLHAGKLIGQVAKVAGGGGGGRPDKAQAGGKDASKVSDAIDQVKKIVLNALSK